MATVVGKNNIGIYLQNEHNLKYNMFCKLLMIVFGHHKSRISTLKERIKLNKIQPFLYDKEQRAL